MKKICIAMLVAASAFLTGCSTAPVSGVVNVAKWDGAISNPGISNKLLMPTKVQNRNGGRSGKMTPISYSNLQPISRNVRTPFAGGLQLLQHCYLQFDGAQ